MTIHTKRGVNNDIDTESDIGELVLDSTTFTGMVDEKSYKEWLLSQQSNDSKEV